MLEDACKEMGLSDEAAEQITTAYGKQAEEKINKVNSMVEFVAKQVKIEREKFYQEHGEPAYRVGSSPAKKTSKAALKMRWQGSEIILFLIRLKIIMEQVGSRCS